MSVLKAFKYWIKVKNESLICFLPCTKEILHVAFIGFYCLYLNIKESQRKDRNIYTPVELFHPQIQQCIFYSWQMRNCLPLFFLKKKSNFYFNLRKSPQNSPIGCMLLMQFNAIVMSRLSVNKQFMLLRDTCSLFEQSSVLEFHKKFTLN